MSPEQCRQARELLGWHQQRLALQANSCLSSVVGFEAGEKVTRPATVSAFRAALETAGVEFIVPNGGGAGVRLRKAAP
jgi:ribosome-binding protein aMBF1 (putative translation factor)